MIKVIVALISFLLTYLGFITVSPQTIITKIILIVGLLIASILVQVLLFFISAFVLSLFVSSKRNIIIIITFIVKYFMVIQK